MTTFPDWLEALSTLALFVAAVVAAVYARRVYQIEAARDRKSEGQAKSEQARLVAGWYEPGPVTRVRGGDGSLAIVGDPAHVPVIAIRNASEVPVNDLRVALFVGFQHYRTRGRPVVPPGTNPVLIDLAVIPGTSLDIDYWNDRTPVRVALLFTDSAGIVWERWIDGSLSDSPRAGWDEGWQDSIEDQLTGKLTRLAIEESVRSGQITPETGARMLLPYPDLDI